MYMIWIPSTGWIYDVPEDQAMIYKAEGYRVEKMW